MARHPARGGSNGQTLLTMQLTLTLTLTLRGLLMSRIAERLARNIMGRHLEAGVQELRHHLEWEADGSITQLPGR